MGTFPGGRGTPGASEVRGRRARPEPRRGSRGCAPPGRSLPSAVPPGRGAAVIPGAAGIGCVRWLTAGGASGERGERSKREREGKGRREGKGEGKRKRSGKRKIKEK